MDKGLDSSEAKERRSVAHVERYRSFLLLLQTTANCYGGFGGETPDAVMFLSGLNNAYAKRAFFEREEP